jgi:hypothetical protein
MKHKLFFVIVVCVLVFAGNYLYQSFEAKKEFNDRYIKITNKIINKTCPAAYVINQMPQPSTDSLWPQFIQDGFHDYVTDVHGKVAERLRTNYLNEKGLSIFMEEGYFIDSSLDHKVIGLHNLDLEWVSKNCNIKPSYVY